MYEKDKERYEQEMKHYTKDKPPKETTKAPKTKKQKNKKTTAKAPSEVTKSPSTSASLIEPAPDLHSSLVEAPTFNILNTSMPFSDIPSPVLEIGDDDGSFHDFDL